MEGAIGRRQLTVDAAAIALRMTTAAATASHDVSASMVRSVRGWSKAQRAIAESWGESMTALGREYVRQMRKA